MLSMGVDGQLVPLEVAHSRVQAGLQVRTRVGVEWDLVAGLEGRCRLAGNAMCFHHSWRLWTRHRFHETRLVLIVAALIV